MNIKQKSPSRHDEETVVDPAIVNTEDTKPQPSISGYTTHEDSYDSDNETVGEEREDVIASEVLDDSDFIERNARARSQPLRRWLGGR